MELGVYSTQQAAENAVSKWRTVSKRGLLTIRITFRCTVCRQQRGLAKRRIVQNIDGYMLIEKACAKAVGYR